MLSLFVCIKNIHKRIHKKHEKGLGYLDTFEIHCKVQAQKLWQHVHYDQWQNPDNFLSIEALFEIYFSTIHMYGLENLFAINDGKNNF